MSGTSIELFAGAGGLGIGLSAAGFKPLAVVEMNKWCCDTLRRNQPVLARHGGDWRVMEGDVRKMDFGEYEGRIDLISGGPPCQPFSVGGRHRAHDDTRDMFPEAVRAVREVKPRAFIFENVKGLTRGAFYDYFNYLQLQLEHPELVKSFDEYWLDHLRRLQQHHTSTARPGLHYKVVTKLLNAANFGVPQRRERVLFVGFRDDVDARWAPEEGGHTHASLIWSQVFGDYWDRHRVATSDRHLDGRSQALARSLSKDEQPDDMPWRTTRDVIADLPDPTEWISAPIYDHRLQPGARTYPGHTGSYIDEPAKTLKAGVHGVPGGENMVRLPDGSVRYFTVRESCRIQTFPDDYRLHGAWTECMRQLGNAVPVELARNVGLSVMRHLKAAA